MSPAPLWPEGAGDPEWVKIDVLDEHANKRCEQVLANELIGLGRKGAVSLLRRGRIKIEDGQGCRRARKGECLVPGQRLVVAAEDLQLKADDSLDLDLVFESAEVVVINKPAGVPSAPLQLDDVGSVANALVARYPEMGDVGYRRREPGLCHRLDTHTSGLLVAARNASSFAELQHAIKAGAVDKRYLAICHDRGLAEQGSIDRALEHGSKTVQVVTTERGNATHFRVLKRHRGLALVEVRAAAAFRHQIRAHLAWFGAPLLGDTRYGAPSHALGHHALHASRLAWKGPRPALDFDCRAPLPDALAAWIGGFR